MGVWVWAGRAFFGRLLLVLLWESELVSKGGLVVGGMRGVGEGLERGGRGGRGGGGGCTDGVIVGEFEL